MVKAAILAGAGEPATLPQLVDLLHDHPDVELVAYVNKDMAGQRLDDIFPPLKGETELRATSDLNLDKIDVIFIVGESGLAKKFIASNTLPEKLRIIDMTGDFIDSEGEPHFVQGIAELNRKAMVRGAKYVALPSAVTQAVVLGLLPLAKNLLLNDAISVSVVHNDNDAEPDSMTPSVLTAVDASDIAKAVTSLQTSFSSSISGVTFHGDIPTGLTAVTTTRNNVTLGELRKLYEDYYDDHSFTFLVESQPDVNDVRGTNKCFIHLDKEGDNLIITTVLDTDIKGSAGNALHAMNLLFGFLERVGL